MAARQCAERAARRSSPARPRHHGVRGVARMGHRGLAAMTVFLINPSHVAFGIGVITPRWLYVLAAATPDDYGEPRLVDETLEAFDVSTIEAGDIVGIGIHTGNALRGYALGRAARAA